MSIDVTIRQKGFFKKELPLKVILGNNLSCGTFDGLRLETDVIKGNEKFFESINDKKSADMMRNQFQKRYEYYCIQ